MATVVRVLGETKAMTDRLLAALGEPEGAVVVRSWTAAHARAEREGAPMVAARVANSGLRLEVGQAVRDARGRRVIDGTMVDLPCPRVYNPDARTKSGALGCRVVDAGWVAERIRLAVDGVSARG